MNQEHSGVNLGLKQLDGLTQKRLETWVKEAQRRSQLGQLPTYIPQLAQVNPQEFGVQILTLTGKSYQTGNATLRFPLMSVIKPLLLLNRLVELGEDEVFKRVGVQPSDQPFNSLEQLQTDDGWPRNPMLNSGAIVLAALLPGQNADSRCDYLCSWLNQFAHCDLVLDQDILESVRSVPNPKNQRLIATLQASGYIDNPDVTLDTYNQICCLSATISDLAQLGLLLAQPSQPQWQVCCRMVKALMMTCGLYQASGQFAVQVGLPTKSGVSGAVLSIIPQQGAIACYSPPLDPEGNSVGSLFLIQTMAQSLGLSVFN
ncbi:glutaminase A [Planktothrix sp. FACHB-1365]|uniref:glutaminase A n=1 Tax=Planktothrix sp. FACHB-1365 TaxID=2692855 RepID=UPI001685CC34|nr:glutaminase A [Planktothrix sp. FACHB-1365]MBD2484499.1 glutaminase A [Planktothrix sp. FACHB-1365]